MVVQATVLQEAPELHPVHHERVVRTLLIPQGTVEVVDLAQVCDMTDDDKDRLRQMGLWVMASTQGRFTIILHKRFIDVGVYYCRRRMLILIGMLVSQ